MFSLGLATRQPSSFKPDLMTTQSSPVLKNESSISTLRLESGSQPSLLGPVVCTRTRRTITFSEYTGWMVQKGPSVSVTPSISTFLQLTV
jgi:hypothetical protein